MARTAGLRLPRANLHEQPLPIEMLPAEALCRVSWHNTGEPHFGRTGNYRFDDPDRVFGTCYLGLNLAVAFAESVLHDREPVYGHFKVAVTDVENRFALSFRGGQLRLANMTGSPLLRLGGNGELSGTPWYRIPQRWSAAVAAHPDRVDGMLYVSRRVNDQLAVVLFQRPVGDDPEVCLHEAVPLSHHRDYAKAIAELGVVVS
jgi:hypothetical protein